VLLYSWTSAICWHQTYFCVPTARIIYNIGNRTKLYSSGVTRLPQMFFTFMHSSLVLAFLHRTYDYMANHIQDITLHRYKLFTPSISLYIHHNKKCFKQTLQILMKPTLYQASIESFKVTITLHLYEQNLNLVIIFTWRSLWVKFYWNPSKFQRQNIWGKNTLIMHLFW